MKRLNLLLMAALLLVSPIARAEITRFEILQREPYANARPQGEHGAYERITGIAHFALDPKLKANEAIVDLPLADRNAEGKVEFWADVEILAPADMTKANGAIFYEVNNRGNKTAPNIIEGNASDFLVRQGFIVVTSGWIGEVLPDQGKFRMLAPVAKENGRPLLGIVRQEIIVDRPTQRASLAYRGRQGSFRPTAAGLQNATLTVREREADDRKSVSQDNWKLIVSDVMHDGKPWPLPVVELEVKGDMQPGLIYEVIYEGEGSLVQGVGLAGIRDLVSLLKYDTSDKNPLRNKAGQPVANRALGFGTSQSGRCLRQFVYDGFNADEQGRKVFDGVIPHVAGGGLGSFNHRFASPTRTNGQHDEHLYPADVFPFTYGESRDPRDGRTDGILRKALASGTAPKIFHTQSSSEYWHRSGSLVHTDPAGKTDAKIPPEVRIYTFGGTQHGPGDGFPSPVGNGQMPSSPADYRPLMRALVVALDAWVRDGQEPPPSVYPKISAGTLVDWHAGSSGWLKLSGIVYPQVIQSPPYTNRGPHWLDQGIATIEPPEVLGHYPVKVPRSGADGNEQGTLLVPTVAVPVATYTSWNLRNPKIGAPSELLSLSGGYIPFARTAAEAQANRDPRPALFARYRDFADYQSQYEAAAQKLLAEHYLLAEDLPRLKALGEKFRGSFASSK
jgi:hypothetical protein